MALVVIKMIAVNQAHESRYVNVSFLWKLVRLYVFKTGGLNEIDFQVVVSD